MSYREKLRAKIHPTHKLGKEYSEIRAPSGTPRFYGVQQCEECAAEVIEHPAGLFVDDKLILPCPSEESK